MEEENKATIECIRVYLKNGSTLTFKCARYEASRMVDELRLYREDGELATMFFTQNISGFSVVYA